MKKQGLLKNPQADPKTDEAARLARRRLWAADVACYYAQKRFSQTGRTADRRIWESCRQETEAAVMAVQEAEHALARSRGSQA